MNVLFVLTSHDQLGDTRHKTGFWLEEFAAPYYVFKDAGATITLASPAGGQPPLDPRSDEPDAQTPATDRFRSDRDAQQQLATTLPLKQIDAAKFDAVFFLEFFLETLAHVHDGGHVHFVEGGENGIAGL